MRKLTSLLLLAIPLLSFSAQADLLDRVRLEDSLRNRVEDVFRAYDPKAHVVARFEYKDFSGQLPGTAIETHKGVNLEHIEPADISKVSIEIFTDLDPIPDQAKEVIFRMLPVERNHIAVEYSKPTTTPPVTKDLTSHLSPEALSTIANDSVSSFSKIFALLMLLSVGSLVGFGFSTSKKSLKEFKDQFALLTAALSEMSMGGQSAPIQQQKEERGPASMSLTTEQSPIEKMSGTALKELFADCYWCHQDSYAAWVWKKLSNEQRKDILQSASFMKTYCAFFLSEAPQERSYHEHPYYIDPSPFAMVSQEDLAKAVTSELSLWHGISPMRQQNLALSLENKLAAMQSPVPKTFKKLATESQLRSVTAPPSWGELSVDDEVTLFGNPTLVPQPLKVYVKSLVWLAQRDAEVIQKALSKYDARALASAWVGPDDVLKKLESALPEKKLKLLKTYAEKSAASRRSDVFASLVSEGLRDAS